MQRTMKSSSRDDIMVKVHGVKTRHKKVGTNTGLKNNTTTVGNCAFSTFTLGVNLTFFVH